jgi:hypothetical protein
MYDLFFLGNQMDEERKRRIREDSCFNDECREEFFFFWAGACWDHEVEVP